MIHLRLSQQCCLYLVTACYRGFGLHTLCQTCGTFIRLKSTKVHENCQHTVTSKTKLIYLLNPKYNVTMTTIKKHSAKQ